MPAGMKVLHRPNTTVRDAGGVTRFSTAGAATTTITKPTPSATRVASSTAKLSAAAPATLATPSATSPAISSRRSPQRRTSRPAAIPPNTPTNGKTDMMALSDASEPPNCCWSDGSAIVALPTCSADTMLASTTLTTAAR
ncbi:hypothetical protein FEP76_06169 [Burkholderia multivorans]|nr:hypothetical protein [Burkholderia multivorans]